MTGPAPEAPVEQVGGRAYGQHKAIQPDAGGEGRRWNFKSLYVRHLARLAMSVSVRQNTWWRDRRVVMVQEFIDIGTFLAEAAMGPQVFQLAHWYMKIRISRHLKQIATPAVYLFHGEQ